MATEVNLCSRGDGLTGKHQGHRAIKNIWSLKIGYPIIPPAGQSWSIMILSYTMYPAGMIHDCYASFGERLCASRIFWKLMSTNPRSHADPEPRQQSLRVQNCPRRRQRTAWIDIWWYLLAARWIISVRISWPESWVNQTSICIWKQPKEQNHQVGWLSGFVWK